ncbi:SDR family NAD(P)-dependent oxidoreductase [Streptomyces misionensis]|uniref:SDR family NAD(P)-dependent oxidoreductase n=1 Tax=Streptomyces misionensis TaxID=67331 RepID=UPI00341804E1
MSTVLITGAATGIGNLTARAPARAGHRVHASMRAPGTRNSAPAEELHRLAEVEPLDLHVVELDVASADRPVAAVLENAGALDVVIHNAGHLVTGYVEAFTAEEIAHLVDVNTLGVQRLNRAALPHLRGQGGAAPSSTWAAPSR